MRIELFLNDLYKRRSKYFEDLAPDFVPASKESIWIAAQNIIYPLFASIICFLFSLFFFGMLTLKLPKDTLMFPLVSRVVNEKKQKKKTTTIVDFERKY